MKSCGAEGAAVDLWNGAKVRQCVSEDSCFCQRRSQPLAYKFLFFFSSFSKIASFLDIVLFKKYLNILGNQCFAHYPL